MSVHLVGGGWANPADGVVFQRFIAEAASYGERNGRIGAPRIAVIAVRDGDALDHAAALIAAALPGGEFEASVTALVEYVPAPGSALDDVDGIIIGGGLTPAYLASITPLFDPIRDAVGAGMPYLGFSAGAAIASERAMIGGWQIGGVPVSPADASEELDEVTIANGIGLVDVTIDVHAAQWGTLARLIAATEADLVPGGIAIDENTAMIVGPGVLAIVGQGSVWRVVAGDDGVLVSTTGASLGL